MSGPSTQDLIDNSSRAYLTRDFCEVELIVVSLDTRLYLSPDFNYFHLLRFGNADGTLLDFAHQLT